jgi:rhodanese-related sulfurtransferase
MATVREITVDELAAARDAAAPPVVLDVRGRAEYAAGHVPGALNIPLDELPGHVGELRHAGPIAAICRSGRRSIEAAEALGAAGISAVSVAGGTDAWTATGRPTHVGRRT